jgi:PAS domain S-box-containing protein
MASAARASQGEQVMVLTLHATRKSSPATIVTDNTIERALQARFAERLDYYADYMDLAHFHEAGYQHALRDFLRTQYEGRKFDLVIATSDAVLEFAARYRDDLFPDVPIVFNAGRGAAVPSNATGITSQLNFRDTLEIASTIQPDTQRTVGGSMLSAEALGGRLAQVAVRVLGGEKPEDIPVADFDANVIEFDWRQLRRWGISDSRLPPGSVVRYRQPGLWEQYGLYIVGAASLMVLQTALISGLLFQRATRRRIERSLRENQQRYALATTAGAVGVWDWKLETNDIYVDPELKRLLGFADDEISNRMDDWVARVHPDDGPSVMALAQACIDGRTDVYEAEHRMLHKDGTVRWFLARGTAVRLADGTPDRLVGTDIDITERKQSQEALRQNEASLRAYNAEIQQLAGRLIEAQETERARIARELHDDASQQIAGLSIAISSLRRRIGAQAAVEELQAELTSLQQRTIGLAASVRQVSHNLHPGVLEFSGLVVALTAHCAEIERQTGLQVLLHADHDFVELPQDHSLCLYRVTQEALRNTATHANASRADVRLYRSDNDAELAVVDDGRGFDVANAARPSGGLGLLSIHERVRLAGGTVSIVSGLHQGTTVRVRIPIAKAC